MTNHPVHMLHNTLYIYINNTNTFNLRFCKYKSYFQFVQGDVCNARCHWTIFV